MFLSFFRLSVLAIPPKMEEVYKSSLKTPFILCVQGALRGKRSSARSARHIPGGLSANLTLPDCGRVARHPVIRQQLGASVELLASQPVNGKIWNDCFLPSRAIAALRTPPGLASGWGCRGRRLSRWRGKFGRRCGPCPCRLRGRRRVQVASAPARRWDR
jgi:hypothetical protein